MLLTKEEDVGASRGITSAISVLPLSANLSTKCFHMHIEHNIMPTSRAPTGPQPSLEANNIPPHPSMNSAPPGPAFHTKRPCHLDAPTNNLSRAKILQIRPRHIPCPFHLAVSDVGRPKLLGWCRQRLETGLARRRHLHALRERTAHRRRRCLRCVAASDV